MNTYQITQITYGGSSQRHVERWIVKARRRPTVDEVRARLKISNQDQILVALIDFPVWDPPQPSGTPNRLHEKIQKYLGKPPYDEPGNTSYNDAYLLKSFRVEYGYDVVQRIIQELT